MKKIKDLYLKEHNSDWEGEDGEYAPVEFNLFSSGRKYRISFKLKNFFWALFDSFVSI